MNNPHQIKPSFSRNIFWNLLGQIAPMLAALISIPILIQQIGTDKFGMVTIAWMLIGYFSLFDFGIGRALTQLISQRLAEHRNTEILPLIWTGNILILGLGIIAAILLALLCHSIIYNWLKIPVSLQQDAAQGLMIITFAIPLTVFATGIRGVLESYQEFRAINLVRIPLGILMFVAPVAVLPFSHSLSAIFFALMLTRLATLLAFLWLCSHKIPSFWQITFSRAEIPILFRFGGWMTISNIISPIMVHMDRLFIGVLLSISAVAYYTTPYEVVIKLLVIPAAIAGVAFPRFAHLHGSENNQLTAMRATYQKSLIYTSVLVLPVFAIILGAPLFLQLWLDEAFVQQSSLVMQILSIGVLVNGLAHIPYALIQGIGKPHITATLHIIELLIYIPLLLIFIKHFGLNGAASAWLIRVIIDAILLFYLSHQELYHHKNQSKSYNK